MYVCELCSCSLISNRTILWIILARILSTAFVHIHENEWTSSLMIFLKSCVYIKGMFNPEINQLMFIIHTCSVLLSFFLFLVTSRRFYLTLFFVYLRHVYLLINLVIRHSPLLMKSTKWSFPGNPVFSHSRGFKMKYFPWPVGPNHAGTSYVTNLKWPF